MINTILAQKKEMDQIFTPDGRVSVTVLHTSPSVITQVKTRKRDGYWGLQLGFGEKKIQNIPKPQKGHLKGALTKKSKRAPRFLREIRFAAEPKDKDGESFKVGDAVSASQIFKEGDTVEATGISKGKGFAGVVKRWGFAGGPATHGQSDRHRAPGSIGQGTSPGRVWKGKKMAGRMGFERTTVKNLKVVAINEEKNEILVSGPVPGPRGNLLLITKKND